MFVALNVETPLVQIVNVLVAANITDTIVNHHQASHGVLVSINPGDTEPMNLIWKMDYSASRRKHHHRCQYCSKIVGNGEPVFMARVANGKTRVVHAICADKPFGELTIIQLMVLHAYQYATRDLAG